MNFQNPDVKALGEKKLYIFDMDGTIYLGNRVFPFAIRFIKNLRAAGKKVLFFTNNASHTTDFYVQKLTKLGFSPTKEQGKVVDSLCEFILSKNQDGVFVLRGFAGTGKTSLVGALVKTMEQLQRNCVLMAPTGRAAKVFALYSDHPAYTIHKRIYRQKSIDKDSIFSLCRAELYECTWGLRTIIQTVGCSDRR